MKKEKVLFILPSLKKTGPINVAFNIISNIDKSKIELTVLSLSDGDLYNDFLAICDCVFIKSKISAIKYIFLNRKNFSKVHSHCVIPDLMNAVFYSRKSISTLHNFINVDYIYEKGFIKGIILSKLHLYALNRIDKVVSCSSSVRDFVKEKYNLSTLAIDNGVRQSNLVSDRNNNCLQFLIVGVCNERKNHSVAIDGFLNANLENAKLIVCGDGPLLNSFKIKYSSYENVIFLGSIPEPRRLMSNSHVFLSSSKAEGLPMALLEALSEGMNYIVSDIGPHQYIYNKENKIGSIVDNDVESFAFAIKKINVDELRHEESVKFFKDTFSSQIMSKKYTNLYIG